MTHSNPRVACWPWNFTCRSKASDATQQCLATTWNSLPGRASTAGKRRRASATTTSAWLKTECQERIGSPANTRHYAWNASSSLVKAKRISGSAASAGCPLYNHAPLQNGTGARSESAVKEEPCTYPHKGDMWHRASANVEDLPRLSFVSFDPSRDIARWRMRKKHIT